ncbi:MULTISPECIES: LytS/YhcK type 5TM receptor domain-containing protein [unclassified Paenibacillus]|uniref:LytS/YhcK type 5TM receptor domain-containing protein n=1 Tax=unclassified Paenibacillus TaxID=185978 RepID=UPI002117BCE5|nr:MULTISPECIES: LytS/YhcK type 5TM receptor domain-containing protein [unclassified Paenibacillus]
MELNILLRLFENVVIVALISLFIGQLNYFRLLIYARDDWKRTVILSAIFGFLSILGTEHGVLIDDALANTRIVGAVVGGLVGGPVVGVISGIIGGIHRYTIGGFTAEACAISTVFCGLLGGVTGIKYDMLKMKWQHIVMLGLTAEMIQKILVLLIAKPFTAALALELKIAVPTTIITILGVMIFTRIFRSIKLLQDQSGAMAANLALSIASRTLPHLRTGLNETSAKQTAEIIHEIANVDAVVITDCDKTLSIAGVGNDSGLDGKAIYSQVTEAVLKQNDIRLLSLDKELAHFHRSFPFKSAVGAKLVRNSKPVGTLQIYYKNSFKGTQTYLNLVDGLAKLLSVQIELAEIEEQTKMRQQAELNALQAQIKPHFLFNTLSTIMSYCRTNPELARNLLGNLSDIFRRNLNNKNNFNSLKEELDGIKSYLEIEKVRFANRLQVIMEIDESLLNIQLPVLTLQPIIENSIHHGLFPKMNNCLLSINVCKKGNHVQIRVEDNGIGIHENRLAEILNHQTKGIGFSNIHRRLQSIYGKEYGLYIKSEPGAGTIVTFEIPMTGLKEDVI